MNTNQLKNQSKKIETLNQVVALFTFDETSLLKKAHHDIATAQASLDALYAIDNLKRTFNNTIRAFDLLTAQLTQSCNIFHTLTMVSPDQTVSAAALKAIVLFDTWSIENIYQSKRLYTVLSDYSQEIMPREVELELLTPEQIFYTTELLRSMVRAGLELDEIILAHIKNIKKELSEIELDFSTRINTDQRSIQVTRDQLTGLSQEFIAGLTKVGDLFILTTDTPTYTTVSENCSCPETRKALFLAYVNRGYPKNSELLEILRKKRHELALLLGYTSYAAYEIEDSMARSTYEVERFLREVHSAVATKASAEMALLKADLPDGVVINQDGTLNQWDVAYLKAYHKKKYLHIDEEEIASYFTLNKTIEYLLKIYEQFFSISLQEVPVTGLWHTDVRAIEMRKDGQLKGFLLLDLHPRANKYTHACEIDIIKAHKDQTAVIVVLANFPPETAAHQSLLKYNDVVTFFHEFGHAIHDLLSNTDMIGFAGTNVKRDFVEMPSQMLEQWMWEPHLIKLASSHYITGEHITDKLIEAILKLKDFCKADFIERQLSLAWLSLKCFQADLAHDAYSIKAELHKKLRPCIQLDKNDHFESSFGHLTGYGARYYGYLWSQVYAQDLFHFIKEHGLLNEQIGERYAQEILSKGGSLEPEQLLLNFLGRRPSVKPFFDSIS